MILVTGASGQLGRLVVQQLAEAVDPSTVIAAARSTDKVADLAALGVEVRQLDYNDPATISAALAGVDQVLLISSSELGERVRQHGAVIDAAVEAGVEHLAYTSLLYADTSDLALAAEHKATEDLLAAAPIATTRLRHGWYIENYTENMAPALGAGAFIGAAGDGKIAAAARADYAAADVAVLTDASLRGGTYELGGDAFTMTEYAAVVSAAVGREVPYIDMPADDLRGAYAGAGLPDMMIDFLVDVDQGAARGLLDVDAAELVRLAGALTPLDQVVGQAAAALS